jgi:hypothetical protein
MTDGACKDVDECDSSPCDTSSELCINEAGGYKCKCAAGYTRVQGRCTQWEEAEKIRGKERKKKKAKTSSSERPHYPWYHLLLPVTIFYLTYKYSKPTMATSVMMTFGFLSIYLIANQFK